MKCPLTLTGRGKWQCPYCGFKGLEKVERECPRLIAIEEVEAEENSDSRGLGDTIAKITKRFGIRPCRGCRGRQQKLNEMFPYKNA
jgi:DNA-directed RNA polymerase subunit RPC12/RpoP